MTIAVKEAIMWDRWKHRPADGDCKDAYCVSIAEIPSIPDCIDPEIKRYIEDEISTGHPWATTIATLFALAGQPVTCVNNVWDWSEGCPDTEDFYPALALDAVRSYLTIDAFSALLEGISEKIYPYGWVDAISSGSPDEISEMNEVEMI